MSETVYLKIEPDSGTSNADNLLYIQGKVEELGLREEWPDSLVFKVNLVLEELGLNILSYVGARVDRSPDVEITLVSEEDSLTIEVSDEGRPFNPLEDAAVPDVEALLDERSVGGLGVHLVRTMMDDLSYQRDEGRNRLKMVTKRE